MKILSFLTALNFAELARNPHLAVTRNVLRLTPSIRKIGSQK